MTHLLCFFLIGFALIACPRWSFAQKSSEPPPSMSFELVREGPADACGTHCREWVAASGFIAPQTPQRFAEFAKDRDLRGSTMVLDSPGGEVNAGIWLGREIRRLSMATTVGKTTLLPPDSSGDRRATLSDKGRCASMCPFVLLGGVRRHVPNEARIAVHQPWLQARRDDAMASTYSAEEWVKLQQDLGRLASYTIEMGGDIGLFETAARIPPWEALRPLTPEEVRRVGLNNAENAFDKAAAQAAAKEPTRQVASLLLGPAEPGSTLGASAWSTVERAGVKIMTRQFPLTIQGEKIGRFEISLACGAGGDHYKMTYVETRRLVEGTATRLTGVGIASQGQSAPLRVESSSRKVQGAEIESVARGVVPAAFLNVLARDGGRPLTVATVTADNVKTSIVIGNTGLSTSFAEMDASCSH